jgi:hypothetical protein
MQVYGDASHTLHPRLELSELKRRLHRLDDDPSGFSLHAGLAAAFIDAAELAQGLADAEFNGTGRDAVSPVQDTAMAMVMGLAAALHDSWRRSYLRSDVHLDAAIDRLAALELPATVECKRPEGYAFYALYPETYFAAAESLKHSGPLKIIGIRSIGLGLAALIAAATGAEPPLSVRPVGHPFARRLSLDSSLVQRLFGSRGPARFVIADEGPGLSGSSFAAVIDLLTAHGVPEADIVLFPSHAGPPGVRASDDRLSRWQKLDRRIASFEDEFIAHTDASRNLAYWFSDLVGPPVSPIIDLSAGRWRAHAPEDPCPPAHLQQEARKYLLRTKSGSWLVKFAGLDRPGRRKQVMASALGEEGFVPEALALRYGFIIEPWLERVRGLALDEASKERLTPRLGAYLGFRARHFPARPETGASVDRLADMLLHNGSQVLDKAAHAALEDFCRHASAANLSFPRVATDNRLHPWEWRETEDGRIVKTDALDHAFGHDLIGCQNIAWDVAGATVEFGLTTDQRESLARQVELAAGEPLDRRLLDFLLPCYLAFQLGYYTLAAEAVSFDAEEQERLRHHAGIYSRHLRRLAEHRL